MKRLLVLVSLCACTLPEVSQEGAHVRLATDPGLTMCGDGVAHMDRFVAALAAEFGRPPPTGDDRILYYWLRDADFDARTICVLEHGGCAVGGDVFMTYAPHDHELVHALAWPDGVSAAFFVEGLAVAYEFQGVDSYAPGAGFYNDDSIAVALADRERAWLPSIRYHLAGAFTAFLIEKFGIDAYFRVYRKLQLPDTPGIVSGVLESELGASLDALSAEFDATRGDCPPMAYQRKLLECSAPAIAWDGVTWAGYRTLGCDQADVVGPFADDSVLTYQTITVPEDAIYALTVIGDAEARRSAMPNAITLRRCGGCDDFVEAHASAGEGVVTARLNAGTYALRSRGPASETTGIGIRIERLWPAPEEEMPED